MIQSEFIRYAAGVGQVWPAGRTYTRSVTSVLARGPHFADPCFTAYFDTVKSIKYLTLIVLKYKIVIISYHS